MQFNAHSSWLEQSSGTTVTSGERMCDMGYNSRASCMTITGRDQHDRNSATCGGLERVISHPDRSSSGGVDGRGPEPDGAAWRGK